MRKVLAFDLGGTKFAFGVVGENGTILGSGRVDTHAEQGPAQACDRVIAAAQKLLGELNFTSTDFIALGVASPGPLDIARGCVDGSPNLPGWTGYSITDALSQAFGNLPARIDNDCNAAALGEYRFGAGKGKKNVVYITISTGIGGGAVIDGRLMRGANGNAAELGHIPLTMDGPLCGCGNHGCWEAYASGTAIARRMREAIAAGRPTAITRLAGNEAVTTHHLFQALTEQDPLAVEIWYQTIDYLGRGLGAVINTFNPDIITIGGGVTAAGDTLFIPMRTAANRYAFPRLASVCSIVPAGLGGNVGVVGAAACAFEHVQA